MNNDEKINIIVEWLFRYLNKSKLDGYVVGISGGIDSALVSTLCAMTTKPVYVISMPLKQNSDQLNRARKHITWLIDNFNNVTAIEKDLTDLYYQFTKLLLKDEISELSLANTKSRLRMVMLYQIASAKNCLVAGTGNKVEDYGIGFFTKYGDGGVDISPIGDLYKTEVYELSKQLGIINEILVASPTDGLWDDNRTDESQIGATYEELEFAMEFTETASSLTSRQLKVYNIYYELHKKNSHKMKIPPICKIPKKSVCNKNQYILELV